MKNTGPVAELVKKDENPSQNGPQRNEKSQKLTPIL